MLVRKARRAVPVLWWIVLCGLPVALLGQYLMDLQVYRNGGLAWWQGLPLYHDFPGALGGPLMPFTYPPVAAVLFGVFALMPVWLAAVVLHLVSFLALTAVCLIVTRRLCGDREMAWTAGLAAAIAALALEPVLSTFHLGQINLVLLALVLTDCFLIRDRRYRGLLIGLAAAIKLTPAVFVLFFLLRKDWRAALNSVAAFTALAVAGFALAPADSAEYWFHALADPSRIGTLAYAPNQSLRGLLQRLGLGEVPLLWLGSAALAMLLAVVVAWRSRDDLLALLAIAAGGLLASPVSWSHHWVWCVPAFLLAAARARGWRQWTLFGGLLAVSCAQPFMLLPNMGGRELTWTFWQHIPGNAYVWIALLALLALISPVRTVTMTHHPVVLRRR